MLRYDNEICTVKGQSARPKKLKPRDAVETREIMERLRSGLEDLDSRIRSASRKLERVRARGGTREMEEDIILELMGYEEEKGKLASELSEWDAFYHGLMDTRQNPRRKFRTRFRKIKDDKAMDMLLQYIRDEGRRLEEEGYPVYVMVEDTSLACRIPKGQVSRLFQKLVLQGLLSQKKRRYAHDTDRNPYAGGPWSGWASNVYYVREDAL